MRGLLRATSSFEVVSGFCNRLVLSDGREVWDLSGGAGVACLGHDTVSLVTQPHVYGGISSSAKRYAEALAEMFEDVWPGWFGGVVFVPSGSDAVETAARLATQVTKQWRIASMPGGYHGSTYMAAALGDRGDEHGALTAMRARFRFETAGRVDHGAALTLGTGAVFVEPVQGLAGLGKVHTGEELQDIRHRCDDAGALLVFDEILCGFGRCGALAASSRLSVVRPDILLLGKAIGAGRAPLAAVVVSATTMARLERPWISGTFVDHATSCAAALDVLKTARGLWGCELDLSPLRDLPQVAGVSGLGYLHIVALAPAVSVEKVRREALDRGVWVVGHDRASMSGHGALMIAPPYTAPPDAVPLCELAGAIQACSP